jgi:hypothetical protein
MSRNRGRKTRLRNDSRLPPKDEEVRALIAAFEQGGAPIVAAIVGAVLVEHELDTLLRARFTRKDNATWLLLTGENGTLDTFHRKIIAGYAFGIYDQQTRANLVIVRHIRNIFAHSQRIIDFNNELVIEHLDAIKLSRPDQKLLDLTRKEQNGAQNAYSALCAVLTAKLIKSRNRALSAKTRRLEGKIKKFKAQLYPYTSALLPFLQTAPKGSPSNALVQSLARQTGDPSLLVPRAVPPVLLRQKNGDKTDK